MGKLLTYYKKEQEPVKTLCQYLIYNYMNMYQLKLMSGEKI